MDILTYDRESRKIKPAGRNEIDVSALKCFWFLFLLMYRKKYTC